MFKNISIALLFIFGVTHTYFVAAATPWEILTSLHPASTKPTQKIKELISKPVEITGFTVVDEFKDGEISEFLFTRTPGSCIHDPLPSPNNMIHVMMPKGKSIPNFIGQKIMIHGVLSMSSRNDSAYEMAADSVSQL